VATVRRLIISSDIATGEIKAWHIPDAELPERVYATGSVSTRAIADFAITDDKIATGALSAAKLYDPYFATAKVGPIPDVNSEYGYGFTLARDPRVVIVTPTTDGVLDTVYEVAVSRTSITLRAGTSGVYARYAVWC